MKAPFSPLAYLLFNIRAVNRTEAMGELLGLDPSEMSVLPLEPQSQNNVLLLKLDNLTDPQLLDRLIGDGKELTEAEISQKLLDILSTRPELMDEVLFEEEEGEEEEEEEMEEMTFRKEVEQKEETPNRRVDPGYNGRKKSKGQTIVIEHGKKKRKTVAQRRRSKPKRRRKKKKPRYHHNQQQYHSGHHDSLMTHMMPALLGIGGLLGFGFAFNPTITYQGDNTTFSTFDQVTITEWGQVQAL